MPNSITPVVSLQSGKPMCNSKDVAGLFGKAHKHVLDSVDALLLAAPSIEPNFRPIEIDTKVGFGFRKDRAFNMTKDGFTLLAMGFTGPKALQFKIAYINRFNEMEETLRGASVSTGIGRHVMREFISPEGIPLRALATEQGIMVVGADFVKVVYVAARERHIASKRGLMPARWADYPSP